MEIDFNIHWLDSIALTKKDASLSLGWIELKVKGQTLELFKERLCMVFITISDLIDFIASDSKIFKWISVDGGEVCQLTKKNSFLIINYNGSLVTASYHDFKQALIFSSKELIKFCKESNNTIKQESAFIDIENSLANMINTSLK